MRDRMDDVKRTLVRLRDLPEDDPVITTELEEIHQAILEERLRQSTKFTELFAGPNLHRLSIGIMLQVFQQWTGTNAINYYAPDIFRSIGLDSSETDILATGVYGAVKVVFVMISFFMIDTELGRRRTLMIGAVIMMTAFYILGAMISKIDLGKPVGAEGYVAMVSIYLFAVGFEVGELYVA
ncbi:hypothetical protein DFQ28_004546 [Apophysomyces sp. BC1034]|nr:hypothetical protein DFQ30_011212 [Apophysomyces sp. BC1015]KAG0179730.1 hypothetical protein DFQ29_001708 [Apophysomyces sp. BC1021]KAG0188655.1 hypothetical protein DFQ28_004546 [Apophysomyces sp. BC1034]